MMKVSNIPRAKQKHRCVSGSGKAQKRKGVGFSLVELMAVVAVISVLVALALPRFQAFIARSRQAEAMNNLGVIDKLQKSFRLRNQGLGLGDNAWHTGLSMGEGGAGSCSNNTAGTKNTLGFRVEDCGKLRYTYTTNGTVTSTADNDGNDTSLSIYPNCTGSHDTWTIRHLGAGQKLRNAPDVVAGCKD